MHHLPLTNTHIMANQAQKPSPKVPNKAEMRRTVMFIAGTLIGMVGACLYLYFRRF